MNQAFTRRGAAALLAVRPPPHARPHRLALAAAGCGACASTQPPHQLVSGLFTKAELAEDVVIGRGMHSRSLEAVAPGVAAQWDAVKNGAPALTDVMGKSGKKFWFKCDAGADHEWEAILSNRVSNGNGCPCCAGKKVSVTNSLATVAPEVAAQWHATKNGATTPADVVANSNKYFWFKC
jgi:hypothetical protein